MTAKQYLTQAFRMKRTIEILQEDILRLEAAATYSSPNLTGMPHNPSPSHSRMADIVCKIIERKDELQKKLDELAELAAEIQLTIGQMENPDHRAILYKRYVESMEWQDIATTMGYCERQIYRIHAAALREFVVPA